MADDDPLKAIAIDRQPDGSVVMRLPPGAEDAIRRERARRHTVATVPSTPRHLIRDAGGMAVSKPTAAWPHVSLQMLRETRDRSPILAPIHRDRWYKLQRVCVPWQTGKPGIRVVHKDAVRYNAVQPEGFKPWIERFESVLWSPSPTYDVRTLGVALGQLMEDLLTINRPVIEPLHALYDPKRIVQWRPVDGAVIWPTLLWIERWQADNPSWLSGYNTRTLSADDRLEIMQLQMNHDLTGAEYVLVREGVAERTYKAGELIVSPLQTRTDIRRAGYPPSHVEEAMRVLTAFADAFDYNHNFLTKGQMAEILFGLPSDMHDDDVDAFVDMWREATQGKDRAWQPPIVPLPRGGDLQVVNLKSNPKDSGWDSFMSLTASLAAAIYRTHVSSLGFEKWSGSGGSRMGSVNEGAEINLANEEGLVGDMNHLCGMLTDLARRHHPDLRVVFDAGINPREQIELYKEAASVAMTRNEVRVEQGRRPRGVYLDDDEYDAADEARRKEHDANPWNWPTDPGFASAMNQIASREMMAQQQQAQAQPGQPDDGFGQPDDGFGGDGGAAPAPYGTPQGEGSQGPPSQPMQKAATYTVHVVDTEYP